MRIAGANLVAIRHPEPFPGGGACLDLQVPGCSGALKLALEAGRWTLLSPVIRFAESPAGPRLSATLDRLFTIPVWTHPDCTDAADMLNAFGTDFARATRTQDIEVDFGTANDLHDALDRASRISGWSLFSQTLSPDDENGQNPINIVPPITSAPPTPRNPSVASLFKAILKIFRPRSNEIAVHGGALRQVPRPLESAPDNGVMTGHDLLADVDQLRSLLTRHAERIEHSPQEIDRLFNTVVAERTP